MIKWIWKKKIVIVALVLTVALLPFALTKPTVVITKTIVTAMGIDKADDGYTVYTESLIFNFDPFGVPEREIHFATAETIPAAMKIIGQNRGRKLSLSHCTVITLGHELEESDFIKLLWPFIKRNDMSNSAVLFWTDDPVKGVMQTSIDLGDARSALLQQMAEFNRRTDKFAAKTLEEFVKDMMRDGQSELGVINIKGEEMINEGKTKKVSNKDKS
ncbi:MAG: hypothetical protein FWE38_03355 [Firmicutes bacterium]|nr:hypothetical protein [Bacillota bacterium]